jgi:hypothetical protein
MVLMVVSLSWAIRRFYQFPAAPLSASEMGHCSSRARRTLCAPCNFVSGVSDVTSHYNLTSEPRGQFCGEWNIRRSYEVQEGPDHLRWFCGEAEFEASWEARKAWAKTEEAPWRVLNSAARLEPADFTKSLLDTG